MSNRKEGGASYTLWHQRISADTWCFHAFGVVFLTEKILILTIEETMTHEVLLHNKTWIMFLLPFLFFLFVCVSGFSDYLRSLLALQA